MASSRLQASEDTRPVRRLALNKSALDDLMGDAASLRKKLNSSDQRSLAGSLGGWMSENDRHELGFLICGLWAMLTFVATWVWVQDASTSESKSSELFTWWVI